MFKNTNMFSLFTTTRQWVPDSCCADISRTCVVSRTHSIFSDGSFVDTVLHVWNLSLLQLAY